jgi:hypothetical protein
MSGWDFLGSVVLAGGFCIAARQVFASRVGGILALVADTNPTTLAKLNVRVGFWHDIGAKIPP